MSDAMKIAKQVFSCYPLGDTPEMVSLVHPDAYLRFPGNPQILPWAGEYRGHEVRRFHEATKNNLDLLEYVAHTFEPAGDHILIFAREHARCKWNGKEFINNHVGIITIRDGLVMRYLEYGDTAEMQAAFL